MREPLRLIKRALSMPPQQTVAKARLKFRHRQRDQRQRRRDTTHPTYAPDLPGPPPPLARLIDKPDIALLLPYKNTIAELADRTLAHTFDLLGSGWTRVGKPHGLEVTGPNWAEAQRLSAMLPAGYEPIDWHVDFKSASRHRWDPRVWFRDQPQVVGPGIDVKVPWELARMQHLPLLAWGYALAGAGHRVLAGVADAEQACEIFRDEFRSQVLDFIAHNPPRYGVNWNCAMDVGIRVAGWALTMDLFRASGAGFDDAFMSVFARSVREHADHLAHHLEWDDRIRGNHYLADIAGLLVASAYLPGDATTDRYLHFAARELIAETLRQFHPDGSNFEASTSYHRLSAEMVVYALSVLQGVTPLRQAALVGDAWHAYRPGTASPPLMARTVSDTVSFIPPTVLDRVARMGRLTQDILDRHGRDPQIGDNDSGRFFKLLPATMQETDGALREDTRNHRHLIAAVDGFFTPAGGTLETQIIRHLLGGVTFARADLPKFNDHIAYPGMGLYLYKHGRLTTIVRCGEVGQHGNGGHAHDDALSFVLYADGEPAVVDPGTGCYTPDPKLRDRMRHFARHNTVADGGVLRRYDELEAGGLFRMRDRARAAVLEVTATTLRGRHHLLGQATCRGFECGPDQLRIHEQAPHPAGRVAAIHLAPGAQVELGCDGSTRVQLAGHTLVIAPAPRRSVALHAYRYSPGYGAERPQATQIIYGLADSGATSCTVTLLPEDDG